MQTWVPSGYSGVSFACWGKPPPSWAHCGLGAANDSFKCSTIVLGQVASVGNMAFRIATGFTTPPSPDQPADMSKLAELNAAWQSIKNTPNVQKAIEVYTVANQAYQGYRAIDTVLTATTQEDMIRLAAILASVLDPTGIANVIASYTYPTCNKLFST